MPFKDKTKRAEYKREYQIQYRYMNGVRLMSEDRQGSLYLGCYIAEKLLSKVFNNVERMPVNNRGYDFKCGNGFLFDVKSSCEHLSIVDTRYWSFSINQNTIPDYFLCIAFDNRNDLNPLYLWSIPGNVLSHLKSTTISETTLNKWSQYEKSIDKAVSYCNQMKNND